MEDKKEKLIRLIKENPELPFVFMADNAEIVCEYNYSVFEDFNCKIGTIYDLGEDGITDDYDYVIERYEDILNDASENITDKEFEKIVKNYIEKNTVHYKAIIVTIY